MKCMIVLSALVALSAAGIVAPYAPYASFGYSSYAASPLLGQSYLAAPGLSHLVQAPAVYSAPAVVAARTLVAAPAAHAVVAAAPAVYAAPAAAVKTQYHAQDELGQASYGHSEPTQAHSAVQDAHGNKVGSFSYVAPDGQVVRTDYVADALGYRVNSNALPVGPGPVAETPEVVAARAAHLAHHNIAKRSVLAVGHTPASTAPLATAVVAPAYTAPLAYAAHPAPLAYAAHPAPLAYAAHPAPLAYSTIAAHPAPLAYSSVAATPLVREATLTTVVNTPGHAVSYRVD